MFFFTITRGVTGSLSFMTISNSNRVVKTEQAIASSKIPNERCPSFPPSWILFNGFIMWFVLLSFLQVDETAALSFAISVEMMVGISWIGEVRALPPTSSRLESRSKKPKNG
jgi:hypothetical protein